MIDLHVRSLFVVRPEINYNPKITNKS